MQELNNQTIYNSERSILKRRKRPILNTFLYKIQPLTFDSDNTNLFKRYKILSYNH